MQDIKSTLKAVEAFALERGVDPATVVRYATNNPRLYERLKARAEKLDEDLGRIERYLAQSRVSANG